MQGLRRRRISPASHHLTSLSAPVAHTSLEWASNASLQACPHAHGVASITVAVGPADGLGADASVLFRMASVGHPHAMSIQGLNRPSVSAQQQQVASQLQQAQQTMRHGVNDLVQRFDSTSGEHLFRSFALTLNLEGADAGARFLRANEGSIGQLTQPQQAAFRSLFSDAKEVAALQAEQKRLSGLQSLQQLLASVPG